METQNNTIIDTTHSETAMRYVGNFVAGASRGNSVYLAMATVIIGMLETGAIKMTSSLFNVLTTEAFRTNKHVQAYLNGFEEGQDICESVVSLTVSPYNVPELMESIKSATAKAEARTI